VEAMTPGEYKKGGEQLEISANNYESPFGSLVIGSTNKGICHVAFTSQDAKIEIANQFPKAQIIKASPDIHNDVLEFIYGIHTKGSLKLHIKGTAFQLKVWEALLNIPFGQLASYGHISQRINHPRANRAVGSAIGKNPIAYLIPCHRVIKSDGTTGGYRWGNERKQCILGWEAAKTEKFQTA
jgi:AraC family transcriptional regulator of adaptative response/methylated-DNA-[protein]-cysteine methyltransferase